MSKRLCGIVTAVTELQDGRIAIIIDVEKVITETAHFAQDENFFQELQIVWKGNALPSCMLMTLL